MKRLRRYLARRKLARMVEANRNSVACRDYARRRAAALKATRGG